MSTNILTMTGLLTFWSGSMDNPDLSCPEGLSAAGRKAYEVIMGVLKDAEMTYTGGCKAFYSPKEWADRGEEYGLKSELIVVYDGGSVGRCFSLDADMMSGYVFTTRMHEALAEIGMFPEECRGWYAAIYLDEPWKPCHVR